MAGETGSCGRIDIDIANYQRSFRPQTNFFGICRKLDLVKSLDQIVAVCLNAGVFEGHDTQPKNAI